MQVSIFLLLHFQLFLCYVKCFKYLFILAVPGLSCGLWDLVPLPGIKHGSPTLGAGSPSHWTTKEVPVICKIKLSSTNGLIIKIRVQMNKIYSLLCICKYLVNKGK